MANSKPLAYFYDIQNLPLPPNKDPIDCIQRLREIFGTLGSEVEFIVACDVIKEKKEIIKALGYIPKLTLPHADSDRKESADKVLETQMIKFASTHKETPGTIVMITSDEGFREQISDLRYKHGHKVILIHGHNVNPQFLKFPNEYYNFYDLMDELPDMNISTKPKLVQVKALLLPVPPGCNPQIFTQRECEIRLTQIFRCRSADFDTETLTATLLFNDFNEVCKIRSKESENVFSHPLKLIYPECTKWRETGECPKGISCPSLHFPESKGIEAAENTTKFFCESCKCKNANLLEDNGYRGRENDSFDIHFNADENNNYEMATDAVPRTERGIRSFAQVLQSDRSRSNSGYTAESAELSNDSESMNESGIVQNAKTLWIGPLSKTANRETIYQVGIRFKGFASLGFYRNKMFGTLCCYLNFTTKELTELAGSQLEQELMYEDLWEEKTKITFIQPKMEDVSQEDTNPTSQCLHVGLLLPSVTKSFIKKVNENMQRSSGCGTVVAILKSDAYGSRYAFFNFQSPEQAAKGKLWLQKMKNEDMERAEPQMFITSTKFNYKT